MKRFVPDRVANLICTAPCPELSAVAVAVDTVTSSIRSSFGWILAKNPSVDRVYLSWMFAPSTVIDIELSGRPLTVDTR